MKPRLSFWQIVGMNCGFFGIQFSFGLQKSNLSPIYKFLGADERVLPYLWLAAPVSGLLVPPIIGALSDRTLGRWGRRAPYLFWGALLCSVALWFLPRAPTLWTAAGLFSVLAIANNVSAEPYRALVSDKLDPSQHALGFLTQSALTGLGQTLAYITPPMLVAFGMSGDAVNAQNVPSVTIAAFAVGAVFSIGSILWALGTTKGMPINIEDETTARRRPLGWPHIFAEISAAIREMPPTMRQLALVKFLQWYAMYCYWQYIVLSLSRTLFGTTDAGSAGFREATFINGQIGGVYNFVAFIGALAMLPSVRRHGPRRVHSLCLILAGFGLLWFPNIHAKLLLFVPMIGLGLAWASIMGAPYIMLTDSIPPHRAGVYMGIFNMFIVIPMIVQILTLPWLYRVWLGENPENVIRLAGALLIAAAIAVLFVQTRRPLERPSTGLGKTRPAFAHRDP